MTSTAIQTHEYYRVPESGTQRSPGSVKLSDLGKHKVSLAFLVELLSLSMDFWSALDRSSRVWSALTAAGVLAWLVKRFRRADLSIEVAYFPNTIPLGLTGVNSRANQSV